MPTLSERIAALEATVVSQGNLMVEVRDDVKSLLAFRSAWLAVTALVSAAIAGIVAYFSGK